MKIACCHNDFCLVFSNSLDLMSPLTGQLEGSFHPFRTGIHGQHLVKAKVFRDVLFKGSQLIVVECAGSQRKRSQLFDHGIFDARMTVSLVDGRVGRQKIIVALAFHIPYKNTFSTGKYHG